MSAGDLAKYFNRHDVVEGYDSNKNKAGTQAKSTLKLEKTRPKQADFRVKFRTNQENKFEFSFFGSGNTSPKQAQNKTKTSPKLVEN